MAVSLFRQINTCRPDGRGGGAWRAAGRGYMEDQASPHGPWGSAGVLGGALGEVARASFPAAGTNCQRPRESPPRDGSSPCPPVSLAGSRWSLFKKEHFSSWTADRRAWARSEFRTPQAMQLRGNAAFRVTRASSGARGARGTEGHTWPSEPARRVSSASCWLRDRASSLGLGFLICKVGIIEVYPLNSTNNSIYSPSPYCRGD